VTIEAQWVHDDEQLAACELDGFGWCPRTGPYCASEAGEHVLLLDEVAEGASLTVQVWRR
jgi:hypothetical protein